MKYSLNDIQSITGGVLIGADSNMELVHIFFDTRKIAIARQGLFICFSGFKRDGHDFIQQAIDKGISHFIVEKVPEEFSNAEVQFLKVPSSLKALQTLATFHRSRFEIPVIGITGSNGKTIVKEWLYTILSETMNVVRSPMSYNSQLGVALSLLEISQEHDIAIIEAAISESGEMELLSEMIKCNLGIFTNIGDAHQGGFDSIEEKINEKQKLFQDHCKIIHCRDHDQIDVTLAGRDPSRMGRWSTSTLDATYKVSIDAQTAASKISINQKYHFITRIQEQYALENLIHCIVLSLESGLSVTDIQTGIDKLTKMDLRLEIKEGSFQNTIIDDSYSFDLISFESALTVLSNHANIRDKVLIVSDIPHKVDREEVYKTVAELIQSHNINRILHVGKDQKILAGLLSQTCQLDTFPDVDKLLKDLQDKPIKQAAILVKGARKFHFEKIVSTLTRQRHQTELEVNLTALRHNLNVFSQHLAAETKILCVIKANAYGTGSVMLARFLESVGVDYLAVAYTDEGIELRQNGINLPIIVLNPELHHFEELFEYKLEPEIYSLEQLRQICEYQSIKSELPLHIKIDTGMNRLGFQTDEIDELMALIDHEKLLVHGLMSHLAAADDPSKDDRTHSQLNAYSNVVQQFESRLDSRPICHILNSSGIIRFPQAQADMVRIGKGMYGIDMTKDFDDALERVHSLTALVSQIKEVSAGSTIGYGCHTILDVPKTIAIINIGYADGLIRTLGNGKISFRVKQKSAPTIGNICMDMCMLDVSLISNIVVGDRVEIFGKHVDIRDVAAAAGTIPLEILSKLSNRLKKVYTED